MHREALWITNKQVADFYRKQFLDSKEAQEYAYRRWGKDYCTMQEIGYAPKDGHAMQQLPVKAEFLKELGLLNRGGYDFYQNRVVIQIHDRFGHVIGFTARCMDDQQPKYLNSSESDIFHKSYVLFGIEDAWKTAAKQDKMFLVEGAPDCMRLQSIGIHNTVAALGSAWNETHFSTIKRIASKVCFLPDADPPKNGESYGHGIQVVMEAGTLAMENGLSVSIKEIPDTDDNKKQDPDTFFKNTNIFNATEETDFILWMADKLFPQTNTTEEQRLTIKKIAYLLSLIDDETGVSMYIGKLTKYYQGRRLWLQAVDKERKLREEQDKKHKEQDEDDLNHKYGFYIDHGCYMSITEKGSVYEWSNFTMVPLFHIKDTTNPKRLYKIKNAMKYEEILELKQEDLIALAKFKQKIDRRGTVIVMLFLLFYRFPEALLNTMTKTFMLRHNYAGGLGLSPQEYGLANGTVGLIGLLLGGIIGGVLVSRDGMKRWLWPMVCAITLPDVVYIYLSYSLNSNLVVVSSCLFIEQFGYGLGFTVLTLYMLYYAGKIPDPLALTLSLWLLFFHPGRLLLLQ